MGGSSVSIPIAIIKDHNVGSRKINTEATSTSGEEEDELFAVRFVVLINSYNSILVSSTTIDTTVLYSFISRQDF